MISINTKKEWLSNYPNGALRCFLRGIKFIWTQGEESLRVTSVPDDYTEFNSCQSLTSEANPRPSSKLASRCEIDVCPPAALGRPWSWVAVVKLVVRSHSPFRGVLWGVRCNPTAHKLTGNSENVRRAVNCIFGSFPSSVLWIIPADCTFRSFPWTVLLD